MEVFEHHSKKPLFIFRTLADRFCQLTRLKNLSARRSKTKKFWEEWSITSPTSLFTRSWLVRTGQLRIFIYGHPTTQLVYLVSKNVQDTHMVLSRKSTISVLTLALSNLWQLCYKSVQRRMPTNNAFWKREWNLYFFRDATTVVVFARHVFFRPKVTAHLDSNCSVTLFHFIFCQNVSHIFSNV